MPNPKEKKNIAELAQRLDKVREFFNAPITVTSGLRVSSYNKEIGGATQSMHMMGGAADIIVKGYDGGKGCDKARLELTPFLESFDLRMEDLPGANWIHLDTRKPGHSGRYFKP